MRPDWWQLLRWYQQNAIHAIYSYFSSNNGNPVIALPTGTGKSLTIAGFILTIFTQWTNQRVLILTHRKELIGQDADALLYLWRDAPIGIFSAGLKQRIHYMPITFGGIKSVYNNIELFKAYNLIIVDEGHLIPPTQTGMYNSVFNKMRELNPSVKIIGFTATAYRQGQGMLTDPVKDKETGEEYVLFTDIIYDMTGIEGWEQLIAQKYLCKPITRPTQTHYDISNVKIQAGEFNQKQLSEAVDKESLNKQCAQEICHYGQTRWAWLIFAVDIEHAEHLTAELQQQGVACECVHSKKTAKENDSVIAAFKRGELRAIVNADKLTTGFDHPPIDLIAIVRHTQSTSLHVQMIGRGTRPYDFTNERQYIPGYDFIKSECLILDFAANIERLGPVNDPCIPKRPSGTKGEMPVKICPQCGIYNFAAARVCEGCGYEFPFNNYIENTHDLNAIVYQEEKLVEIKRFPVIKAVYKSYKNKHVADSKPQLWCSYFVDGDSRMIREIVLFEHTGFARSRAERWFQQRLAGEVPATVEQALSYSHLYRTPRFITVRLDREYPEVQLAEF
ncbi:MAG TPA: DEAD/DEAH box helicase family protein [bacterium]|nr:DEAD/DEAH box helicase family protein [bacterium]